MNFRIITCLFLAFVFSLRAQENFTPQFTEDTMTLTGSDKILNGRYTETTLKDGSIVRLFQNEDGKFYLRLMVARNFYFGKVGMLEIVTGKRSISIKDTEQHKVSKTMGLFIVEVWPNYIRTLADGGITSLNFAGAETKFTRQDAKQVKSIASFMNESLQTTSKKQ